MIRLNPKAWLHGLREGLQARDDAARRSLAGAASERWLAGELFAHLATCVGDKLTAYPEAGTRDLTVYPVKEGEADWRSPPVAALELKLVYRSYSENTIRSYIRRLIAQVERNGEGDCKTYGYLFAVFVVWGGDVHVKRASFKSFRKIVGRILREECPPLAAGSGVRLRQRSLTTLLHEGTVKIGGATARVGLAGQYLVAN